MFRSSLTLVQVHLFLEGVIVLKLQVDGLLDCFGRLLQLEYTVYIEHCLFFAEDYHKQRLIYIIFAYDKHFWISNGVLVKLLSWGPGGGVRDRVFLLPSRDMNEYTKSNVEAT